jgi:hypothetical protein
LFSLTYDHKPYTTKLPGGTKYFLTRLPLVDTKITIENGCFHCFPVDGYPGNVKKKAFRKERQIVKRGGEWVQIVNGFIKKEENE